jgi:two-component system, LytTR family, sensor kinase
MAFYYANTLFFIPRFLSRKLFFSYFLSVISFSIFICFCTAYTQVVLNPNYSKKPDLFKTGIYTGIISSVLVWFISSGIKITSEWLKNQQAVKAKENERLSAELSLLKLQVNPHFLFNSLNNIYALQTKKSTETGSAILMLSELIRYMLYDTLSEFVPLKNEIKYLHNYVEMQKLGISDPVKINFTVEGDVEHKQIEPMLLIPLVENVFKHGISYAENSLVTIDLKINENVLELRTENPVVENYEKLRPKSGFGLANLKKRLDLLYHDKYQLLHSIQGTKFVTYFKINLNNLTRRV